MCSNRASRALSIKMSIKPIKPIEFNEPTRLALCQITVDSLILIDYFFLTHIPTPKYTNDSIWDSNN